jgi:hypothetical protein
MVGTFKFIWLSIIIIRDELKIGAEEVLFK